MELVIVAGGLGSRLAPLTDHVPKFLVNIGKETGYVEMIRYWGTQFDLEDHGVTVIVHPKYVALVAEYHALYFPKIRLTIKTVEVANGSAHAIMSTCGHLEGQSVLFTWCDVIPAIRDLALDMLDPESNIVFTNYSNSNRYAMREVEPGVLKPVLDPSEQGGCFGLYYVGKFRQVEFKDGQDFIDVIEQYGPLKEQVVSKIIDFGDMPKLRRTQSHADDARSFNAVKFVGDYVLKEAVGPQGKNIMKREIAWYKRLDELLENPLDVRPAVPRTWIAADGTGFFMDRVQGVPIWKAWPEMSPADRLYVIQQHFDTRRDLFNLDAQEVPLETLLRDVKTEAYTKLVDRYNEIRGVIDSFGPVTHVNGYELKEEDPLVTIKNVYDALERFYTNDFPSQVGVRLYGFVHGDLQFSNAMVDMDTRKVTIIDPRGYFGKSELIGLEDYDIGKLLYALSGYDTFNTSREFFITKEGAHLEFTIPAPSTEGIEEWCRGTFIHVHYLWLAVCWLGLAQYIKNDPVKSMAAHYHGLMLAERALSALYD